MSRSASLSSRLNPLIPVVKLRLTNSAFRPVTGKKALFVNRNFTTGIKGLSKLESDALLEMLYRHCETPEFQCRFRWQPNSVAFWDNRSAQHHAMWDYFPQRRHGYRVTVKGDRPFFRA